MKMSDSRKEKVKIVTLEDLGEEMKKEKNVKKTQLSEKKIVKKTTSGKKTYYLAPNISTILKKNRKLTAYRTAIKNAGYTRIENKDLPNDTIIPLPEMKGVDIPSFTREQRQVGETDSSPSGFPLPVETQYVGDTEIKITRRERDLPPAETSNVQKSSLDPEIVYITSYQANKLKESGKY